VYRITTGESGEGVSSAFCFPGASNHPLNRSWQLRLADYTARRRDTPGFLYFFALSGFGAK
jgi:hypothetical protein